MTRRFNLHPLPADEITLHAERARMSAYYGNRKQSGENRHMRGNRARRLMLHWWRASADPRRSLLRCGACDGRTVMWSKDHGSWFSCPRCAGTGKAVKL